MRLLTVVLAVLLLAPAAEAAAKDRPPCRPKGARTLDGSGAVRVYALRGRTVACSYATRRTLGLGRDRPSEEYEGVAEVVVRGRWVAWRLATVAGSSQGPYSYDRLGLADVRLGRVVAVGSVGCDDPFPAGLAVTAMELTTRGRLAWICSSSTFGVGSVEVRKLDADGPGVLDRETGNTAGTDYISSSALAIAPPEAGAHLQGRVYWSRLSGARSADLR